MSAAAWRWVWQRPASFSDLWRLTHISRGPSVSASGYVDLMPFPSNHRHLHQFSVTSSRSRSSSASAGWWRRPAERKDGIFTLPEPARFYYSGGSRVRQFGTANQRPASLSDPGRVPQISGSPSAQAMTEAAAWRRPTSPTFSSSRGQASAPSFIDRMPCPSNLRYLLQFFGTSSRSPSASAGWWRRPAAARFYYSGASRVRQFATANQRQRHLYLVLDDHENGSSIYKLDMNNNDLDGCCGSAEIPRRLPEPPVLRIGPPTIGERAEFAALGSHIIAISRPRGRCGLTLIFDTKTATFSVSEMPTCIPPSFDVAIAVRNKLYFFEHYSDCYNFSDGHPSCFHGALHCLAADPNDDENWWSWRPLSCSPHFSWSFAKSPLGFPFDPKRITGYVVHPRTGTIFVTAFGLLGWGTYSYGSGGRGQWKRRGGWVLPFKGLAHYDHVLGVWVGLHVLFRGGTDDTAADGYLCACGVMSGWQPPKWKVGKEKLFLEHPDWRHVDVKLIHMGEGSKYCLLERLRPEGAVDKMNYVIRLTTFIVKCGEDGELRTMAHRPARFYKAPSYQWCFGVQAFWI